MQTTNRQAAVSHDLEEMEAGSPARPEPFVTERMSGFGKLDLVNEPAPAGNVGDGREALAAAFRKLGRGTQARTAWEQTKDFYKSGGRNWTRGLS